LDVFQRCQAAGKGLQISCEFDELDVLVENLTPEGVWLRVAVENEEMAGITLKKVSKWV
jgi:hypothetical protein